MKESKVIKGIKKGDQSALKYLYDTHGSYFYGIALRYLTSVQEAEDAVQDTFIKIYQNIDSYKKTGSFEGWMKRILINTCLNYIQKSKSGILNNVVGNYESEDEALIETEDIFSTFNSEEIVKMIQGLPEGYRMVLNLYVMEGYSHREIGELINISESASRSQLTKARAKLREKLVNNGIVEVERVA